MIKPKMLFMEPIPKKEVICTKRINLYELHTHGMVAVQIGDKYQYIGRARDRGSDIIHIKNKDFQFYLPEPRLWAHFQVIPYLPEELFDV
jgi:hypothetical protein